MYFLYFSYLIQFFNCPLEQFEVSLLFSNFLTFFHIFEYFSEFLIFNSFYIFKKLYLSIGQSDLVTYLISIVSRITFSFFQYDGYFFINFLKYFLFEPKQQNFPNLTFFNIDILNLITTREVKIFLVNLFLCYSEVFLIYLFLFLLFLLFFSSNSIFFVSIFQLLSLGIYQFIFALFQTNCNRGFYYFYLFIFLLFLKICFFNLLGIIPYVFSVTSHIIFTLNYSIFFFLSLNLLSLNLYGFFFLNLFLPSGVPLILAPFLIIIELISYIARVFSLAIRLFANLMAGHTLLNILSGFSWSLLFIGNLLFLSSFVVFGVILCVLSLESIIALLQGYVFTILVIIYLNDACSVLSH